MKSANYPIIFKPLLESQNILPKNFDNYAIEKGHNYHEVPGQWYSRNRSSALQGRDTALIFDRPKRRWNFVGSFQSTLPKGLLIGKSQIKVELDGVAWVSFKLIESTVTEGGISIEKGGSWKKLDTVRENELFLIKPGRQIHTLNLNHFYNKPFNVSWDAFRKGFRKINLEMVTSVEVTVRIGRCTFYSLEFV